MTDYPYEDGDVIVLGPETFVSKDGAVLCWKGENYTPQPEPLPSFDPPEPSLDDVVYVVAVRSAAPKDGHEIPPLLDALRRAGVEPVTAPLAAAKAIRDSGSADHDALVRLGFDWGQANTIFTVVSESHA
jgi:hypothetical protein